MPGGAVHRHAGSLLARSGPLSADSVFSAPGRRRDPCRRSYGPSVPSRGHRLTGSTLTGNTRSS